jgi:hypothetical protein
MHTPFLKIKALMLVKQNNYFMRYLFKLLTIVSIFILANEYFYLPLKMNLYNKKRQSITTAFLGYNDLGLFA